MNRKQFNWIMVIGWMLLIFIFSSQAGDVSNENNKFVIYVLNWIGIDLNSILGNLSDFIIRKSAHFIIYFILYILLYRAINTKKNVGIKGFIVPILIVIVYAISDEVHQAFVPGRGPALKDVLVDTTGGLTAFLIMKICVTLKTTPNLLKKS